MLKMNNVIDAFNAREPLTFELWQASREQCRAISQHPASDRLGYIGAGLDYNEEAMGFVYGAEDCGLIYAAIHVETDGTFGFAAAGPPNARSNWPTLAEAETALWAILRDDCEICELWREAQCEHLPARPMPRLASELAALRAEGLARLGQAFGLNVTVATLEMMAPTERQAYALGLALRLTGEAAPAPGQARKPDMAADQPSQAEYEAAARAEGWEIDGGFFVHHSLATVEDRASPLDSDGWETLCRVQGIEPGHHGEGAANV
jgi:hypothetical protein